MSERLDKALNEIVMIALSKRLDPREYEEGLRLIVAVANSALDAEGDEDLLSSLEMQPGGRVPCQLAKPQPI